MQYEAHLVGQGTTARGSIAFQLGLVELDQVLGIAAGAIELGVEGCRIERRPPRLDLDVYPYLPRATVETTRVSAYMGLLGRQEKAA